MQGTYWLTVLPETSQLRPRIKRALRGVDDDARVTPTVDDRHAEKDGRAFGDKFKKGFERSGASKIGAAARFVGVGFKFAATQADNVVRNIGGIASGLVLASRLARGFSLSLLAGATAIKLFAGGAIMKVGIALGFAARQADRLATQVARVTSAILVLSAVGKLLSFMNRSAKLMAIATIGTAALIGGTSALASVLGGALVSALMVAGAAIGVFAGAAVGLLGPAIGVAKLAFKGLSDGAKAFTESMKDVWGPADEAFNKMIGERMGPLLTQFRDLKMVVTDTFSNALTPGFNSVTSLMDGLEPRFAGLSTTLGRLGSEVAGALASPANAAALDKMFAASDRFFQNFLGESGLSGLTGGLVQFAATAADTFAGAGKGINEALLSAGEWLRNISPAQMTAAFAALKTMVTNVWNVLRPVLDGIRQIGAVSAPALAPGVKAIGDAIAQATPGLVRMSEILMPALSAVMERLAPILPALVTAFTPWAGVLATIAPPIAEVVAKLAPLAPLLLVTVGAVKAFAIGLAVYNTAMLLATNATKIARTAIWLLNAAFVASPIGWIVLAIAAAGAALWAFFTKTETGRKMWEKIWPAITNAVKVAWAWIKDTLGKAWTELQPSLMKIAEVAKQAFGALVDGAKKIWPAIQPAILWLGKLWLTVQKFNFTVAIAAIKALASTISWWWQNVTVPAFKAVSAAVQTWWAGAQIVWAAAKPAIQAVGDVIMWLWHNVAVPAFEGIKAAITTWWDGVQAVWGFFTAAVDTVGKTITTLKDAFTTGFNAIKSVVETVWNTISGILDKIKSGIGGVVDGLRNIPVVGRLIPGAADGRAPGFAGGRPSGVSRTGVLRGPGTGTSDSILAMLSNGEGVVKESAMAAGGGAVVAALNAGWVPSADFLHAMLPGFADGKGPDISVAESLAGTPYSQASRFDCSGTVARVINGALGVDGGLMSTKNAREWLSERGFVDGSGGPGQISVGWYDHGPNPNDGHMAMTLSDGRNAEAGGKNGVFTIGAGAAGADDPQFDNRMYLPQMYGEGAGSSSSLGASTSASAGSSRAVQSARTSLKNAGQAVDDRTFARDRAQARLDEAKAAGKDTTDEQHRLDVANRELADAKEKQTVAGDRLAEAEQEAATETEKSSKSGGGVGDLGKSIVDGFFETIGLDGSVFSNPFEWPTIKSIMAGVNVLGSALTGGSGSATSSTGAGGDPAGLLGALTESTGLDMLTNLNPNADIAAPAGVVAPDTTAHGTGNGQNPGPAVVIENAGMSPTDVKNTLTSEFNARTRTTKVH